jgi:C1A family cysteine protease
MINDDRDAGSMLDRGMHALTEKGVAREDLVRHESYLWRDMSQEARADAANHKGFECYRVDDESELASGLALGFVGVVAVHANSSYRRLDARGVRGTAIGPGNHAVGVQDVRLGDDGDFEFDEVGSWGRSNGQDGYAWLSWKQHLRSTVERHAFYLIRAASDPLNSSVPKVK